jgi:hypothetical protein
MVVYVIDTRQGSKKYPPGSWDYLEAGMMIETEDMGLVHCPNPDAEIVLKARSKVNV